MVELLERGNIRTITISPRYSYRGDHTTRSALGPTGRFAVKSLAELVGKVASLYDTQERVRRSEEECGLTTSQEPTQSAQGTTTMHSRRHQRISSNALDTSNTEELQV